jgi:hypothetical protein
MAENEEVRNLAAALPHLVESIETFLRDQDVTDKALVGPVGVKGKRLIREAHEFAADLAATLHEIKFLPPPEEGSKRAASYFRTAALVTMKDLQDFFKGSNWRGEFVQGGFDGTYGGETLTYTVKIIPKGVTFYYKVWATEDPSDSEEGVSDEPLKSLAEFVGQGLPGGEMFERMSSSPEGVARALRHAARTADRKILRRISSVLATAGRRTADSEGSRGDELEKLFQKMRSKGWRAEKAETKEGEPSIKVEIGEQFEAVIEFSDINYDFEFGIDGHPDLTKSGLTDDPIREFQRFYRSPEVESVYEGAKSKKEELQSNRTVPSGRRKTE